MLRKAGDFPNRDVVEYATVLAKIPNKMLPLNLQVLHSAVGEDEIITLGVSPTGRLKGQRCYLESIELAERLRDYVEPMFKKRSYRDCFKLEIVVNTTTRNKTVTRYKERDSAKAKAVLG